MKTEHTHGPWRIDGKTRFGDFTISAGQNVKACEFVAKTQSEANARLIASAPDLLHALKCLVRETSFLIHGDGTNGAIVANEISNAIATIGKGEGF